jgi:LacI family transcriptional regulator
MASIKEVAALAGVTPPTVSRLLNGDASLRIREETRERILAAAATLDYIPNRTARALRLSRVGALGVALRHLTSPVYAQIFQGAQLEGRRADFMIVAVELDTLSTDETLFKRYVKGSAIDGLIVQRDGLTEDAAIVDHLMASGMPFVVVNERVAPPLAGVALDDVAAARLATEHLIGLGHRRIAHLAIGGASTRSTDREAGWRAAMEAAELPAGPELLAAGGDSPERGFEGMDQLLDRNPRPTGVVAATLLSAIGAQAAIHARGLDVPRDVSLVAHHDSWLAQYAVPPLTVVRLPLTDLGRDAVKLLIDQINGGRQRQELLTEPAPEVVVRSSTGPAPR